eukprot:scaffold4510_cov183-Amphora_coffeaeformis.AAC.62
MVNTTDGFEVEFPPRTTTTNNNDRRGRNEDEFGARGVRFAPATSRAGPVDLDDLFSVVEDDTMSEDGSLFAEQDELDEYDENPFALVEKVNYFNIPNNAGLLDNDASLIPGSPFSKPGNRRSTRPSEPLGLAKLASVIAFIGTIGWVAGLIFLATFNYNNVGRIVVEILLAIIAFLGLFWNTYFVVSSICKCFIPAKAFTTNTKFCSIIPETKPDYAEWLDVTIQIPVYKESLQEVLMPTLKSCMAARDYYATKARVRCNIVVCDDGMMAFLRDNFAAAEMLWDAVQKSNGRIVKLSQLLKTVPKLARSHLRGMRSHNVYEVFHRMLFYYHYKIGFVARSAVDRRGKFKKASNLNSHLQLALGAAQLTDTEGMSFHEALMKESHHKDGSRFVMFGNDIKLGHLICVNDADARMAESVILKTVPEFLNDPSLGFTQHTTKTMTEQRGETYYTNLLSVYTDALYQGHFLLSSIMGCHPPMVGHSIFLRTEAVRQCGRMRMLRHAQRWLRNIGLPFLPVDQIGFVNLHANNRAEYWSENHVSEDFELMIHLYNLGFNGRYCAYPDCEFQEGITRTFDEEAGRHRKFALGAHELVFNPFQEMLGHGVFTPLFRTFMASDIPSYYKVFLTAYLCSYSTGGAYILVFIGAALVRIFSVEDELDSLYTFSPAGIIVLNIVAFYIIGYITFLISLLRMHYINNKLLFPEYRKKCCGALYIIFVKLRYCLVFQFLFYSVASITFYFLGSMDHMLSRPTVCGATNKDSIEHSRCAAFASMVKFNVGSWFIACAIGGLGYLVMLEDQGWDPMHLPHSKDEILKHAMFTGPPVFFALLAFIVPIILNPYILGWPFVCRKKKTETQYPKPQIKKDALGRVVDIKTFMNAEQQINKEMERVHGKQDVELGTVRDLFSHDGTASPRSARAKPSVLGRQTSEGTSSRMDSIPELGGGGGRVDRLGGSSHSDRLPGSSHSRSRGSSDYRTTATQPTGSSDSSRASRRDKKGRPVFDI